MSHLERRKKAEAVIPEKKMPKVGDIVMPSNECFRFINICGHDEIKKKGCKIVEAYEEDDPIIYVVFPNGRIQGFAMYSNGNQRWARNSDPFVVFYYFKNSPSVKFCSCENPKVVPSWVVHPDNKFFYCRKCKKERK